MNTTEINPTKKERLEELSGCTIKVATSCGNLYVTVNFSETGEPFEVFVRMGKAGGCSGSFLEAIGRLISLGLRSGVPAGEIISQLKGIRCPNISVSRGVTYTSCADVLGQCLERFQGYSQKQTPEEKSTALVPAGF